MWEAILNGGMLLMLSILTTGGLIRIGRDPMNLEVVDMMAMD